VPDAVAVLADAFEGYPVMRFVLGTGDGIETRMERLITFFVMARVLREEPILGVRSEEGRLDAVALVSRPGRGASPAELGRIRETLWAELGAAERARYQAFGAATAAFDIETDHLHLNMIGVRRQARGRGLARTLLDAVHVLSLVDPASTGVSLTTEVEDNLSLYRRFGYEVIGRAEVTVALTTWGMFRPDADRAREGPAQLVECQENDSAGR
jgi:ribosomal protein S18 acetylase RimI-like enzyme